MSFLEEGFAISRWSLPEALCEQACTHVESVVQRAIRTPREAHFWTDFRGSARSASVLFQEGTAKSPQTAIRYGHALHHADPFFAALVAHQAVQRSLEEALGPRFSILQAAVVRKPPGLHEAQFGWHQDAWYLPSKGVLALAFIALDPMTLENGCLEVLPRAHLGARTHTLRLGAKGFASTSGRDPGPIDTQRKVALPMQRGTIALLHGHAFHASGPNRTALPRRALIVHALEHGAELDEDAWLLAAKAEETTRDPSSP